MKRSLQRHPQYPLLPPPELHAVNSPDACDACPNHVTERGCPHLQNQAWEDKYLMRILHAPSASATPSAV